MRKLCANMVEQPELASLPALDTTNFWGRDASTRYCFVVLLCGPTPGAVIAG